MFEAYGDAVIGRAGIFQIEVANHRSVAAAVGNDRRSRKFLAVRGIAPIRLRPAIIGVPSQMGRLSILYHHEPNWGMALR
jgi:hypothetical protein